MAKTRKKELAFTIKDQETQTKFLELIRKKITMVNINVTLKHDKLRITLSGTHESVRYAIQMIKQLQNSIKD
ncbi:MAG TPA: DUF2067 family protein [Candidatus Deferrimicrobium sp.]|nr:DUF2067 family protein [Candidatus Deferrimicrobium sp.]